MKINESEIMELKTTTAELKDAIISIASILNKHQKGELYFGINNKGDVVGQDVSDKTLRDVGQTISDNIEPKIFTYIENVAIEDKQCIYVKFEGKERPYYAYGRAYIRVGDQNKQLSSKEIENIILDKNREKMRWDNQINEEMTLKDVSEEKVRVFVKKAEQEFVSIGKALRTLEVMKEDKFLNAAIIFFDKNPRKKLFNFRLRCAVFAGTTTATIIDRQEFEGDILQLIEQGIEYVRKNVHVGMRVEGAQRIDIPEINLEAVREAITNSYCHRDYYDPESVEIAIFQDRIEIRNPGAIFGGLSIEQLLKGEAGKRRNPLIAELLRRVHFGEKWGRGLKFILEKEKETIFKDVAEIFSVTFKRKEQQTEKVTENQKLIIEAIRKNPQITSLDLSKIVNISDRKIKENISKLKDKGIIQRVGPDKGGHWEILK